MTPRNFYLTLESIFRRQQLKCSVKLSIQFFSNLSQRFSIYDLNANELLAYLAQESASLTSSQWEDVLFQLEGLSTQMSVEQIKFTLTQLYTNQRSINFKSCLRPLPHFNLLNHTYDFKVIQAGKTNISDETNKTTHNHSNPDTTPAYYIGQINKGSRSPTPEQRLAFLKPNCSLITSQLPPHWVSSHFQNSLFDALSSYLIHSLNSWKINDLFFSLGAFLRMRYVPPRIIAHFQKHKHLLPVISTIKSDTKQLEFTHITDTYPQSNAYLNLKHGKDFENVKSSSDTDSYIDTHTVKKLSLIDEKIGLDFSQNNNYNGTVTIQEKSSLAQRSYTLKDNNKECDLENLDISFKIDYWHSRSMLGLKCPIYFLQNLINQLSTIHPNLSIEDNIIILRCLAITLSSQCFLHVPHESFDFSYLHFWDDSTITVFMTLFKKIYLQLLKQRSLFTEKELSDIFEIFTHIRYKKGYLLDPLLDMCVNELSLSFNTQQLLTLLRSLSTLDIRYYKLTDKLVKQTEHLIDSLSLSEILCFAIYSNELGKPSHIANKAVSKNLSLMKNNNLPIDLLHESGIHIPSII